MAPLLRCQRLEPGSASPATAPPGRAVAATLVAVLGAALVALRPGGAAAEAHPALPALLVAWGLGVVALRPAWTEVRALLAAALLVRVILALREPFLSDDVYRYVWEGRVWLAGHHPFASPPDAPELAALRDEVWARVNHRGVSSIYPPLAQALFVALAGLGAKGWQVAMGLADVGTAWLLFRRRPAAGWLWALCPLPALEAASSGHLEGVGVLLLVAALGGSVAAGWAGAMVKLLPGVVLVPLVGRRPRTWALLGLATVGAALPLALAGPAVLRGFETYRATWAYNGSAYPLARLVLDEGAARGLLQAMGAAVVATVLLRSRDPGRVALWTTGAFVLLSPTVHPWYVLWPWAAALWNGSRAWTVAAVLVPVAYVVLWTYDPAVSRWEEPLWTRWLVWTPTVLALAAEAFHRLTRANPAPVH